MITVTNTKTGQVQHFLNTQLEEVCLEVCGGGWYQSQVANAMMMQAVLRERGQASIGKYDLTYEREVRDTYRTKCGRGRVSYHPEWSPSQPWASYIDGTAGRHFPGLLEAQAYFIKKGMSL